MRGIFTALAVSALTITLTGDILLDRGVRRVMERHGMERLFSSGVDSVLRSSDVVVGNLECPATKVKAPVFKQYIFRGEPEWLSDLKRHGITHLNLANNHSIDQGREGLLDTQRNISAAGMVPIGAGRNMQEAAQPVLLATQPRNVWLVASLRLALENFAYLPDLPCVSQESFDSLCLRISRLRQDDPTGYIIVSLHWGWENHTEVLPQQRQEAHRLIDAGADALVCHHTHTLQPMETYCGKPIYYSIGNFIFDRDGHAALVRLTIHADKATAEQIPITIRNCTPTISQNTEPQIPN